MEIENVLKQDPGPLQPLGSSSSRKMLFEFPRDVVAAAAIVLFLLSPSLCHLSFLLQLQKQQQQQKA